MSDLNHDGTITATAFVGDGSGLTNVASAAVAAAAAEAAAVPWGGVSGKPTSVSGYGITDALSPVMTALGDISFGGVSGANTRLAGNTANVKKFLVQTGTGSASAAPIWGSVEEADIADGSILARLAADEAVTGAWTFSNAATKISGNLRVGSATAPTEALDVTGNALVSGTATVTGGLRGTGVSVFGYSASLAAGFSSANEVLQAHSTANGPSVSLQGWSSTAGYPGMCFARTKSGVIGTHTALTTATVIGGVRWAGSDGVAFFEAAAIRGVVDGTVSTGIVPGRVEVYTTNTSGVLTKAVTVDNAQSVAVVGGLSAATLASIVQAPAYAATVTINCALGGVVNVGTLTGNITLANPTGVVAGMLLNITLTQDATGGRTVTFGGNFKFGTTHTNSVSTAANKVDTFTFLATSSSTLRCIGKNLGMA